jgi:hypothetical protein
MLRMVIYTSTLPYAITAYCLFTLLSTGITLLFIDIPRELIEIQIFLPSYAAPNRRERAMVDNYVLPDYFISK